MKDAKSLFAKGKAAEREARMCKTFVFVPNFTNGSEGAGSGHRVNKSAVSKKNGKEKTKRGSGAAGSGDGGNIDTVPKENKQEKTSRKRSRTKYVATWDREATSEDDEVRITGVRIRVRVRVRVRGQCTGTGRQIYTYAVAYYYN